MRLTCCSIRAWRLCVWCAIMQIVALDVPQITSHLCKCTQEQEASTICDIPQAANHIRRRPPSRTRGPLSKPSAASISSVESVCAVVMPRVVQRTPKRIHASAVRGQMLVDCGTREGSAQRLLKLSSALLHREEKILHRAPFATGSAVWSNMQSTRRHEDTNSHPRTTDKKTTNVIFPHGVGLGPPFPVPEQWRSHTTAATAPRREESSHFPPSWQNV